MSGQLEDDVVDREVEFSIQRLLFDIHDDTRLYVKYLRWKIV